MNAGCVKLVAGLGVLVALTVGSAAARPSGADQALPAGALEKLEALIKDEMKTAQIPGLAYAVVQGDQILDTKAYGVRALDGNGLVDSHTIFQIGSASKAFTATMVAMLVEEGRLAWDDRVVGHLPQFAMHDPWVTREMRVADLICQRSGMPPYALDSMSSLGFGRQDIIRALRFVEPVASFRSAYAYQNNLWLVAAALIEQKTGLSWEDNLDRRIFGPLGMVDTTTNPEVLAGLSNVASGHFWVSEGGQPPVLKVVPANWQYRQWLETYGPAGSIRASILDLARWAQFQINLGAVGTTRLVKPISVAYLHAPKTLASPSGDQGDLFSYASGWVFQTSRRHPMVWHNGGTHGQHSIIGYLPEAGVGLVMLTNEPSNQVPEHALVKLAELVFGGSSASAPAPDLPGEAFTRPPVRRLVAGENGPPLPLERYVGTYINPAYGPFEVRLKDGRLELVFGPLRHVSVLQPVSGNTFDMPWPGWSSLVSRVTFTVPAGRPAEKLVASMFEDVQGGTFVRTSLATGP